MRWTWLSIGAMGLAAGACSLVNAPDDPVVAGGAGNTGNGGEGGGGMLTCEIDADCASGDDVCLIPHCENGVCNNEVRDGQACDDGLFCTDNDTCDGETCSGAARVCPDQGPCAVGLCDEANDACSIDPLEDGDACDDGVFCTLGETCTAGACGNGATNPCDSTNPCEMGNCDATSDACVFTPVADGALCDDGVFCTVDDACSAGSCVGPNANSCGDGLACTADSCVEASASCENTPITACANNDGCCPTGCNGSNDNDCCPLCDPATEVDYMCDCYYLDGSGGVCDQGYVLAPQQVLYTIGPSFAGKNYKHTVSSNCCIWNSEPDQDFGMLDHCNVAGPFSATDVSPGAVGCSNVMIFQSGQLTLCMTGP